jgi:hypothetical protein
MSAASERWHEDFAKLFEAAGVRNDVADMPHAGNGFEPNVAVRVFWQVFDVLTLAPPNKPSFIIYLSSK